MDNMMTHGKQTRPIVLASASPRRRELLTQAGYNFIVEKSDIDESQFGTEKIEPCKFAEQLALAKAKSVAPKYPDKIVLGADTIVDYQGTIIGKAADEKEAGEIVGKLFSRPHRVITGVALVRIKDNTELVTSNVTTVYPKKMSREQIEEHIRTGIWQDKAGAYAIQENGDEFVERIEGSLTNVMGLPMELLERLLGKITI
ncbi:MAG: septum formation protein Maf [Sedimentisphaerales bacterium]|nr:septum formation protein Maf [Sedimentisphaerales bacterium]